LTKKKNWEGRSKKIFKLTVTKDSSVSETADVCVCVCVSNRGLRLQGESQ